MISSRSLSELHILQPDNETSSIAQELSCSLLTASVLQLLKSGRDINSLRDWIRPDFIKQMNSLNLGEGSQHARDLWNSKSSFGNVLVYGDYDVDGVCSSVLAMEIFRNKAAQVKYFIPRRDIHGYGLNQLILDKVPGWGCNTLVVVDCGTNDSIMLEKIRQAGINVFVFDHHSVSAPITIPTVVNPSIDMEAGENQKICATAVLWCWAWKENIVSKDFLRYSVDLPALATISDCMPLKSLNRLIVRHGLERMRSNPRRGLAALFDCLSINKHMLTEEHLSMRVIPCLNAPGRIATADASVRTLLGVGSNDYVYSCVNELMRINRKRQQLTESITKEIDEGILSGSIMNNVIYRAEWPIGVLSGVASRICAEYNRPVVLASPTNAKLIRGTLRVPEGGDAVAILHKVSSKLDAWGGHKFAAGFSVTFENWPEVNAELEEMLSAIEIKPSGASQVIAVSPADISINDWKSVCALGPYGNDNPSPLFYVGLDEEPQVFPLGKDGKHSYLLIDGKRLLAFGVTPKDIAEIFPLLKGCIYHPRMDYWRNEEQLQFILDTVVVEGGV